MISVVIPTMNSAAGLPRCFDSLIGATVRGLVKEVIVADAGSTDETLAIADAAGCHVVAADAGPAAARGDWLLFLLPETALEPGWENEVESFMATVILEQPRAATFRFALDAFGAAARRHEWLANLRAMVLGPSPAQGLLLPRRMRRALNGKRPARSQIVQLRCRAIFKGSPQREHALTSPAKAGEDDRALSAVR